jgi:probable rRNA maturation factor
MIEVEIEAEAWSEALPEAEQLTREAAEAVLASPSPEVGALAVGSIESPHPALRATLPPSGEGDLVILLTDDASIQALNRDHRGKDAPTNVLSFPAAPSAKPHLGDVALAFETCAREAAEGGKPLAEHLQHLVAHGVLHLLGWDHQTEAEAEAMEAHERVLLASLGRPDPYRERDIPSHG